MDMHPDDISITLYCNLILDTTIWYTYCKHMENHLDFAVRIAYTEWRLSSKIGQAGS
jgi:hypothetical protein